MSYRSSFNHASDCVVAKAVMQNFPGHHGKVSSAVNTNQVTLDMGSVHIYVFPEPRPHGSLSFSNILGMTVGGCNTPNEIHTHFRHTRFTSLSCLAENTVSAKALGFSVVKKQAVKGFRRKRNLQKITKASLAKARS